MSKTSGVDANTLVLPKGGGAVQGLGETFEADLNTGTGSFNIPIHTPPGPNAIAPRIGLRYHSSAGNGPYGLGWDLGLLAIARKSDGCIPTYAPDGDRFVLVGAEDLLLMQDGSYRPRVDPLHWRIERRGDGWELTDTKGVRQRLGQTDGGRVEAVENGLAKAGVWLVEEAEDPNGNTIRYTYIQDGAQRYLERVEWGSYHLAFFYEGRPDPITSGRYGFLIATRLRCRRIELHALTGEPSLARAWTLEYRPGGGLSLLSRVTLTGYGADGTPMAAPVVSMTYSEAAPATLERFMGAAPGIAPGTFGSGRLDLVDWYGDGLPALLELGSGKAWVWPNLGRARWGPPCPLPALPAPVALDETGTGFADMEGNGTADLVMLDRPLAGYYPLQPGRGFGPPVFWRIAPDIRLTDPATRLVDLNGDGVVDLLSGGKSFFRLYYRSLADGWRDGAAIPRSHVPPVSLEDPGVRLADMNGDGLPDLVRVEGRSLTYWPYLGHGRWADAVEMLPAPNLPPRYDLARLYLVDVDGDGCADLVYVDYSRVLYWLNVGGSSFGEAQVIDCTPPAESGRVRLADMKGTGGLGLLWSSAGPAARPGHLYLDVTGGVKPYLLTGISNGLGLETHIRYRSSTEFALDDAATGRRWRTFHPFPLQCVGEIELRDTVTGGSSLTRYHYHEGRYDGRSRTFLGFRVVETEAVGDEAMPTLLTRHVYHLGLDPMDLERPLVGEERQRLAALRRRLLRTEVYGLDGSPSQDRPYEVVNHDYATRVEPSAGDDPVVVPYETRTLEEQWERGDTPFAYREIAYLDWDSYGNILRQHSRAWRAGQAESDQEVTTEATFAVNETTHLVSFPARVTQRNALGQVVSVSITYYDGPPHEGLTEGQVTTGNITRRVALAVHDDLAVAVYGASQPDWEALGYWRQAGEGGWWVTLTSYERQESPIGLALVRRSPRGADWQNQYDPSRQFLIRVVDPAGNVVQGTINEHAFQMASLTDANGQIALDRFDSLGRVIATLGPGDTDVLPGASFAYRTELGLVPRIAAFRRERIGEAGTLDEYLYLTGRGEPLQRVVEGEGDPGRHFIAQETCRYSARGLVCERYLPYYVDNPEYAAPPPGAPCLRLRYDAAGRLLEKIKPSGARLTQDYRPGETWAWDEVDNSSVSPTPLIHGFDAARRLVDVVHRFQDGHVVAGHYQYDVAGRIVRVVDPDGGEARMTYDLLGRALVEETPAAGRTVLVYNAAGNQVQRISASGKSVRTTYDVLERVVAMVEDGADSPELVYSYLDGDQVPPPDGECNRRGRAWQVQDRVGILSYAYDERGRVVRTRRRVDALGGRELVTDFAYDALGRRVQVKLPEPWPGAGRRIVDYQHNARGLPVCSPGYVPRAEYDVQGHLTYLSYQNGVENLLEYDLLNGRPDRLQVLGPDGEVLRDQTFSFDPVGNLTAIASPLAVEAGQFAYDDLYRLTAASYGSGEQYTYTYGNGGNVTSIGGVGDLAYDGPPGRGAVTAAGGASYSYDADGNLSAGPQGHFYFDGVGNLVRVDLPGGRRMDCVYDFQGQRAFRRVSDGAEAIWADAHLEFHNGQPVSWVTFAGRRILAIAAAGSAFLHSDLLGTPTLYTGPSGTALRRLAFAPYGALRYDSAAGSGSPGAGPPDPVRLAGQVFDAETGLFCLGRRYYDPRLGRFISPDWVVAGAYLPDGWNRYAYAHNNPLRYADPSGRFGWGDFFAVLGVAVVVAALVVGAAFTGGATLAIAGSVTLSVSGLLSTAAVSVAVGATLGGIAAARAGGDIWAGLLFGGFVGGVGGFAGSVLGAWASGSIGAIWAGKVGTYVAGMVGGAVQLSIAGAYSGAAVGYGGGAGSAEGMWDAVKRGAIIGAITGAALGAFAVYLKNTTDFRLRLITTDKVSGAEIDSAKGFADTTHEWNSVMKTGAEMANKESSGLSLFGSVIDWGSGKGTALWSPSLAWLEPTLTYGGNHAILGGVQAMNEFTAYDFDWMVIKAFDFAPFNIWIDEWGLRYIDEHWKDTTQNWLHGGTGTGGAA